MREYLLQFMGEEAAMGVQFMVALLAVLVLFGVFVWFLRLITGKGRRKVVSQDHRLAILDRTQIDDTRSLVLVRRDDVEHLVMIGGPSDVVVESNIGEHADEHDRHSEHPLPGHEIARRVIAQRPLRTMSLSGSAATVAESIGLAAASRPEVSLAPPPPPENTLVHEAPSFKAAEPEPEVLIEPQSAEEAHPVVIPPEPPQPEVPVAPETVRPAPAVAAVPVATPPVAPAPVEPTPAALAPVVSMPVAAAPVPEAQPAPAPEIMAQPAPEPAPQPAPQPVQSPQPAPAVVAMPEPVPEPQPEASPQPDPQPVAVPAQPVAAVPVSASVAPAVAVAAPAPIPTPEPAPVAEQVAPVLQSAPQPVPQQAPVLAPAPQQAPPAPAAEPEPTPRDLSAEMETALMQELEQPPASLSRVNHVVRQEQQAISTLAAREAPTPAIMPAAANAEQQGHTTQQEVDLSAGLAAAMGLEPEVPAAPQYSEEQRAQDDLALEDAIAGMLIGDQPQNGTSDPAESSVYSASESVPEGPERPVDTTRPGRVDDEMSRLLQELAIPSRA